MIVWFSEFMFERIADIRAINGKKEGKKDCIEKFIYERRV